MSTRIPTWHCRVSPMPCLWQLALEEALLEDAEANRGAHQWFRVWGSDEPVVVVGRAGRLESEVDLARCQRDGIPVLRRCTGGGAVVLGPGCLVYSLVLSLEAHPFLHDVGIAHRWVLQRVAEAVAACGPSVEPAGISDLACSGRKVSGNAMKIAQYSVLYHGTLLWNASLDEMARWLRHPPKEPDYRAGRSHSQFLTNLAIDPHRLSRSLARVFGADKERDWPKERTRHLVEQKYSQASWHQTGRWKR